MKEFMHNMAISDRRRDEIIYRLMFVAKSTTLFSVTIAAEVESYCELQQIMRNIDCYGRSAYAFCFQSALSMMVEELLKRGYKEKVAVVTDKGQHASLVAEMYQRETLKNFAYFDYLGTLAFEEDEDIVPLQAADLIAWEAHRYAISKISGHPQMSRALALLAADGKHTLSRIWDKRSFAKMLEGYAQLSLECVPLEFLQTPEGQLQATEMFERNAGKINLVKPSPELAVPCPEAVLVERKLYRKRGKRPQDSRPPKPPLETESIQ